MTPQTDTLPPKPEPEEVQDAQGGCLQQACSLSVAESALIGIAAEMLRPGVFLSDFAEDHPKRTPKWVIKAAEKQRDQLQRWATKIASTARSLRKANNKDETTNSTD